MTLLQPGATLDDLAEQEPRWIAIQPWEQHYILSGAQVSKPALVLEAHGRKLGLLSVCYQFNLAESRFTIRHPLLTYEDIADLPPVMPMATRISPDYALSNQGHLYVADVDPRSVCIDGINDNCSILHGQLLGSLVQKYGKDFFPPIREELRQHDIIALPMLKMLSSRIECRQ